MFYLCTSTALLISVKPAFFSKSFRLPKVSQFFIYRPILPFFGQGAILGGFPIKEHRPMLWDGAMNIIFWATCASASSACGFLPYFLWYTLAVFTEELRQFGTAIHRDLI